MKSITITFFLLYSVLAIQAQDKKVEINLRLDGTIGGKFSNDFTESYGSAGYSGEVLYFFKPKIAAGAFFSKTPESIASTEYLGFSSTRHSKGDFGVSRLGLSLFSTTNRLRFFRAYAGTRVAYTEYVHAYRDQYGVVVGERGISISAAGGISLRLSKFLTYNVLDVSYTHLAGGLSFTRENFSASAFQLQTGFTVGILTRK